MFIRAVAFLLFPVPVVLAQQYAPILPAPKLTPGDTFEVKVQDLCVHGYTKKVRNVPAEMKREVYEEYGITSHGSGDYEVDHLIPLELGGSNSIKNLWPESHRTSPWNAKVKDRLEGKLHELVCSGQLDLKTAQQAIAADWIEAYKLPLIPSVFLTRIGSEDSNGPLLASSVLRPSSVPSSRRTEKRSRRFNRTRADALENIPVALQSGFSALRIRLDLIRNRRECPQLSLLLSCPLRALTLPLGQTDDGLPGKINGMGAR